ncbi:MAG: TRAP transporter small permease [Desulfosarcinaceae bacterium]
MKTIIRTLNKLEEGTLALTLLGLALMAFMEVVSRYVFNHSFTWFEELSRYLGVFMTFLGASLGVKYGTHFSMDLMVRKAGPRGGALLNAITCLVAAALFCVLAYLGLEHMLKLKKFGVRSAAMQLPMYIAYLPIALFSATMALRLGIRSAGQARDAFFGPEGKGSGPACQGNLSP